MAFPAGAGLPGNTLQQPFAKGGKGWQATGEPFWGVEGLSSDEPIPPVKPYRYTLPRKDPTFKASNPDNWVLTPAIVKDVQRNNELANSQYLEAAEQLKRARLSPKEGYAAPELLSQQISVSKSLVDSAETLKGRTAGLSSADAKEVVLQMELATKLNDVNLARAASGAEPVTAFDLNLAEGFTKKAAVYALRAAHNEPVRSTQPLTVKVLDATTRLDVDDVAVYVVPVGVAGSGKVLGVSQVEKVLEHYSFGANKSPVTEDLTVGTEFLVCVGKKFLLKAIARLIVEQGIVGRCKPVRDGFAGSFLPLTFLATSDFIQPEKRDDAAKK